MKRFLLATMLALASLVTPAHAALDKELDSICKIRWTQGGWSGSGTSFAHAGGYVFVLTAAHVCPTLNGTAECQFQRDSFISAAIVGHVFRVDASIDTAVLAIPDGSFAGVLPRIIPLGTVNDLPGAGGRVDTAGCPGGAMPTGERLHVIGYEASGRMIFGPRPEFGRSGSGVFTADGTKIVSLISAFYTGSAVNGGGTGPTCDMIRKHLFADSGRAIMPISYNDIGRYAEQQVVYTEPQPSIIGRIEQRREERQQQGTCPPGGCPVPQGATPWPPGVIVDIPPPQETQVAADPAVMASLGQLSAGQQAQTQALQDIGKQLKPVEDVAATEDKIAKRLDPLGLFTNPEIDKNPRATRLEHLVMGLFLLIFVGPLVAWLVIKLVSDWTAAKAAQANAVAAANPGNVADQQQANLWNGINAQQQALANLPQQIAATLIPLLPVGPAGAAGAAATAAGHQALGAVQAVQAQLNTVAANTHATALATPAPSQAGPTAGTAAPSATSPSPVTVQLGSGTVSAAAPTA